MDCGICCESFTKTRKQISCSFCSDSACTSCHKRYLLDSIQEPHCMSCKKAWSVQFMNQSFTKQFITKEYREKREIVYFKQEETFFITLLPVAEQHKELDRLETLMMDKKVELQENEDNEDQMVRDQRRIRAKLDKEYHDLLFERNKVARKDVSEKKRVIMKCPLGECKGFLDSKFFCGMCNSSVCKDCHIKVEEEKHACDPNEVATVAELSRSTKPCPKCHTRIFKTDGCDQMFCVQCHTAFSWRTGLEETGVIHNPHYFQALRDGRIEHERHRPHQGGCGVLRPFREIRDIISRLLIIKHKIEHHYGRLVHHRNVKLNRYNQIEDRTMERIKFMIGKIDDKKYKNKLYVYHQKEKRKREEQQIITTYVNTAEELFRMLTAQNIEEIMTQLAELQEITIKAIDYIDTQYQHKGLVVSSEIIGNIILP